MLVKTERTNTMKDEKKDFDMNDDGVDETKEMHRPEDAGDGADDTSATPPKVHVRPKRKAAKAILDYLDANDEALPDDIGQFEVNEAVIKVVDALYDACETDGTVPTREGFAERCEEPSIGQTVLSMPEDPFVRKTMSRKAVAAICAGCVAVVALVGAGVWFAVGPQPSGGVDGYTPAAVVSSNKDDDDVSKDETSEEKVVEGETTDDTQTGDEGNSDAPSGTSDGGSQSSGSNGGSGNASKPSGNGGSTSSTGGSGSNGDASSQQPAQPQHTHNWVPVTTTVHHDAEYKTVHHDAVTQERSICNSCGADITGNESAHMKEYALKGDMSHSYSVVPVVVQPAYDENVLVSAAWDETVTTGYRCSICGATK